MEKYEGCRACEMEDVPVPVPVRVERSAPEPLPWQSDGFEYTARGITGTWSMVPFKSALEPMNDSWVLRGRRYSSGAEWRYFGAFQGLANGQAYAAKYDEARKLYENLREDDY